MKVLFINNDGGGFAKEYLIPPNTRVRDFVEMNLPGYEEGDLKIRVNRGIVTADQVLEDGDQITATATKIEGA